LAKSAGRPQTKALLLPPVLTSGDLSHAESWETGGGDRERCHWRQSSFVLPASGYSRTLFFHQLAPTGESLLHEVQGASPLPKSRMTKLALTSRNGLKGGRL